MADAARERRTAIRKILESQTVTTQHDLARRLEKSGIRTTQATLSRDLGHLRAQRLPLSNGRRSYSLDQVTPPSAFDLIARIEPGAALVVVRTAPGGAQAVAAAIDRARVAGVLGTIAGDDTIFVAPDRRTTARGLCDVLIATLRGTR